MKILGICKACNKRKLFIAKRSYNTVHAGIITNKNNICGSCKKGIIKQLGDEIKK